MYLETTPSSGCRRRRYPWPLVRALMGDIMDQVLREFEAEAHVEVLRARLGCALHVPAD
jgi:hypothetical protein